VDDQTLVMADVARKAIPQIETAATEFLRERMEEQAARELAATLATGTWTRDYPIRAEEARSPGFQSGRRCRVSTVPRQRGAPKRP
jgi:hypothetical protein